MDKKINTGMLVNYWHHGHRVGLLVRRSKEKIFQTADLTDFLCEILPCGETSTITKLLSGLTEVEG